MNDPQKLLDLFYRLHWVLGGGVPDRAGYGPRDEDIAAGRRPRDADIYEGRHPEIYSTACNLHIRHHAPGGTAQVNVERRIRGGWTVGVSCPARGMMTVEEARTFQDDILHAVKRAELCEEILARPLDFDVREASNLLNAAAKIAWEKAGPDADPEAVLDQMLESLNG